MSKTLKFIDKVLTKLIDWLYLKRTIVRLRLQAKGLEDVSPHVYPVRIESIDKQLKEYGLSIAELSKTSAMSCASNVDATLKA